MTIPTRARVGVHWTSNAPGVLLPLYPTLTPTARDPNVGGLLLVLFAPHLDLARLLPRS